jgi:hypothetical protein
MVVPFVLPGPPAERETAAGWRRWRLTRHDFTSARSMSLAEYRRMSPNRRVLHDLHRHATHANLRIQETPMSTAVSRTLWSRLQSNALKHKPTTRAGLIINGGGYQGKTETACEVAAAFEDQWLALHDQLNPDAVAGTRDEVVTVAYVQTPVTATPKSVCTAILDFYGAPRHRRMTLPQLVSAVRSSLFDHGTKALLLDDITRLRLHREADQDALDLLRSLMIMNLTLVLIGVGVPDSGLLNYGRELAHRTHAALSYNPDVATQTARRFDMVTLDPFRYDTNSGIAAWITHLAGIEEQLRLLRAKPGMLTTGVMPEYLFRRTAGIVGLLERLIEDGCTAAIDSGAERLTTDLLDDIDIRLDNHHTRDAGAGEIPDIPTHDRPTQRSAQRRGRNTVFDDHGPTARATKKRR